MLPPQEHINVITKRLPNIPETCSPFVDPEGEVFTVGETAISHHVEHHLLPKVSSRLRRLDTLPLKLGMRSLRPQYDETTSAAEHPTHPARGRGVSDVTSVTWASSLDAGTPLRRGEVRSTDEPAPKLRALSSAPTMLHGSGAGQPLHEGGREDAD